MKSVIELMDNLNNGYYGHGTGEDEKIITSILNNGLRCSHNAMEFTTYPLGIGRRISPNVLTLLNKWPHHEYKKIIIVSLPIIFNILDNPSLGTYQERYGAFCYIPDKEAQEKYQLTNSRYIMPEFILGCYNAKVKSFRFNPKYYERLSNDKQQEVFRKVKENYINIINEGIGIREYQEVLESLPEWKFPLSDEEISQLKK